MSNTATIQSEVEKISGKSIAQLAKLAKKSVDRDGDFTPIKIASGLSVVWISNPNYGQGWRNGYGVGLYARIQTCGVGVQSIRLTDLVK